MSSLLNQPSAKHHFSRVTLIFLTVESCFQELEGASIRDCRVLCIFLYNLDVSRRWRAEISQKRRATLRKEAGEATGRPGERRKMPLAEIPPAESAADSANV